MIRFHIIAVALTVPSILSFPLAGNGGESSSTVESSVTAGNTDVGVNTYGEITETIPQEGSSDTGEPPSQKHPTVTASDPSMWDKQPHQDCVSGGGHIPDMDCMYNRMSQPNDPQNDEPAGNGPRTITITNRQAATLIAQGSGITRQPPGPKVVISKAFIVYTNPTARHQTTTILGTTIDVEFTPTSYTWSWGDGTTTTTTDPGHPYPHQTVTHHYQHTATAVTTTLTTTWTTRYRPTGDTTWHTIEGTITTTETSTPYDLVRITSYLTDDAEEAQGH